MVDVLLVGLHPAVLVADQGVGHRVLVDAPVGGDLPLVAGAAYQGDAPLAEGGVDGGQHAGVVAGAEVDAHRVAAGAAHRLHIPLQALDVLHRHGGHLLEDVGGGGDAVGKGNDTHAVLHDAGLVAHADASDAGDAGVALLQSLDVLLELGVVGQQHDKLGIIETLERLVQAAPLAHTVKLLHAIVSLPCFLHIFQLYVKEAALSTICLSIFCQDLAGIPASYVQIAEKGAGGRQNSGEGRSLRRYFSSCRSFSMARFSRRDTCTWLTPRILAHCCWVSPL